jgi:hypothetical protein
LEHFEVFGGCLASAVAFPELRRIAASDPTWTLSVTTDPPPQALGASLGSDSVEPTVAVTLHRIAGGFALRYDDTGTFAITHRGTVVRWHRPADASEADARLDVLGRVLAVAMHAAGLYVLHASAVAIDGFAVAFVAAKHTGKSTLASALVSVGARLLSDDALPLVVGGVVSARPGVHAVRLLDDSLGAARLVGAEGLARAPGDKTTLRFGADQIESAALPLAAVYSLRRAPADSLGHPLVRQVMSPVAAAVELLRHAKLGPLLGADEAPAVLDLASRIAAAVPVHTLDVARDLALLPDAAASLLEWHAGQARADAPLRA